MGGVSGSGAGGPGDATTLRMVRLTRLARRARRPQLLRAIPELRIRSKCMMAAMRWAILTLALILILLYMLAITLRSSQCCSSHGKGAMIGSFDRKGVLALFWKR